MSETLERSVSPSEVSVEADSPTEVPVSDATVASPAVVPSVATSPKAAETKPADAENKFITLNLVLPQSTEGITVTIGTHDHIHELRQMANERPETCYKTCFSLQHKGKLLDEFSMIQAVEGLSQGDTIKCVAEQYSLREARLHMKRVRALIQPDVQTNAQNGVDNLSLTFASVIAGRDVEEDLLKGSKEDHGADLDTAPPEHLFNESTLLTPLYPDTVPQLPQCVNSIGYSGWNPPPGNRRMIGDLFYLVVSTLEEQTVHITAVPSGFYVNKCTDTTFDPNPAETSFKAYTLIDTLKQVSAMFNKNFLLVQKHSVKRNPYEVIPVPYPTFTWCTPEITHSFDTLRAEEAYLPNSSSDEMSLGMMSSRDWNEELQSARELPQTNIHENVVRDRTIFRVTSDFVSMAIKGAQAVVDGNIPPLNGADDRKSRMYLWNNIFFSLGFDMKEHYGQFGGDSAAYAAIAGDLRGISVYQSLDTEGLHTLGTVIVDYRGYRVVGQSIISGILSRDQEQSIVYGSIDNGVTINSSDKFNDILAIPSRKMHLRPHSVVAADGTDHNIITSFDCKGIVGNDGRHYLIDLFRTFAPDTIALGMPFVDCKEEIAPMFKCPVSENKLATLRPELIESFVCFRYVLFTQHMSAKFLKERDVKETEMNTRSELKSVEEARGQVEEEVEKTESEAGISDDSGCNTNEDAGSNTDEGAVVVKAKPKLTITESDAKEILDKIKSEGTAKEFGSIDNTEFDIRFNPDIYTKVPSNDSEEKLSKDKLIIQDMAMFLSDSVIAKFVYELKTMSQRPLDGIHLTDLMHARGINMRYLGTITQALEEASAKNHNFSVCLSEIITRSVKTVFKSYIIDCPGQQLAAAVAHFMNCYLSCVVREKNNSGDQSPTNPTVNKKKKNKKGKVTVKEPSQSWSSTTSISLHQQVTEHVQSHFGYTVPLADNGLIHFPLPVLSMIRLFCRATGVQLLLRDYDASTTFVESDIMNIFPVTKHTDPRAKNAKKLQDLAEERLGSGYLAESHELITDALNNMLQVYGPIHADIEGSLKHLAHICYLFGRVAQAVSHQKQGLFISERLYGIDHYETVYCYVYLALFSHNVGQTSVAIRLMYRARYLLNLIFGPDHLEQAAFDINIGLMLHTKGEAVHSLRFLQNALRLHKKFHGTDSIQVAMCNILVARARAYNADFREAMKYQKHALEVYTAKYGPEDKRTKDCNSFLQQLTQKAVELQKWMKNSKTNKVPSMMVPMALGDSSISEVLATVNGIPAMPQPQKSTPTVTEEPLDEEAPTAPPPAEDTVELD